MYEKSRVLWRKMNLIILILFSDSESPIRGQIKATGVQMLRLTMRGKGGRPWRFFFSLNPAISRDIAWPKTEINQTLDEYWGGYVTIQWIFRGLV